MPIKMSDALAMMQARVCDTKDMEYCLEHGDKVSAMVLLKEGSGALGNLPQVAKDLLLVWAIDCNSPIGVKKALSLGANPQVKFMGDVCTSLFPAGGFEQKGERALIRAMRKGETEVIQALIT